MSQGRVESSKVIERIKNCLRAFAEPHLAAVIGTPVVASVERIVLEDFQDWVEVIQTNGWQSFFSQAEWDEVGKIEFRVERLMTLIYGNEEKEEEFVNWWSDLRQQATSALRECGWEGKVDPSQFRD